MGLYDFTTKEVLNKVFRTASGDTVSVNDGTTQERLNAVLDTTNNRLNVSLANTYWAFCHNTKSDIETDEYYLPWSDDTDSTTAGNRTAFQTIYNMTLKKFVIRMGSVQVPHTLTLKLERVSDKTTFTAGNTVTIAEADIVHDGTDHMVVSCVDTDFDVTPKVIAPELAILTLQADVDPQSSSNELYMSSVWDVDLKT
jgi:hypothetical protein|tara:strand:+ start:50 stop:643 length:594 start_codon:yes stop_codon:yes gene_type:complete